MKIGFFAKYEGDRILGFMKTFDKLMIYFHEYLLTFTEVYPSPDVIVLVLKFIII